MRILLAALLALPLLAAPASAQLPAGPCGPVAAGLGPTAADMVVGRTGTLNGTVQNRGSRAASALVTVEAPAGWEATAEPGEIALGGGAIGAFTVHVAVPANATSRGEITVRVQLACSAIPIDRAQAAPVTSTITPVQPQEGLRDRAAALISAYGVGLLGLVAVGAVGAAAVAGAARVRGGLRAEAPEPLRSLKPGRGTSFPLTVENRDRRPDTVRFEVGRVPAGWAAFTAVPEITLAPNEKRTLWLMVRSPASAGEGSHADVAITVRSDARPGRARSLKVRAEVRGGAEGAAESGISP